MEMKDIARHKTLWKMNPTSEPLFVTGAEVSPLKKFTIPKIRRTTEKVYLSPCCTNTREYSFIHDTLNQARLDVGCDLRSSWQFGDTKLVHNKDLEKKFASKRSEMRESGRHGRELEENFCFLALPQSTVAEIYQNGLSTKTSPLKILGNPLLGIYVFRHVDVALNYAHTRGIAVENILIFKVLFGKVKKIQPSVDKNKVCLDPSPNFDCHMSRNTPCLKDNVELQAHSSAVYVYEYNFLSKPVDKPRQCLPYAVVTVKFIGHKDNGHLMTSLRFLSTGFPKRAECIIKSITNSSKKRPLTVDKCEDSQEQEKNTAVSSCKKQKIDIEDVPKTNSEKTTLKLPSSQFLHSIISISHCHKLHIPTIQVCFQKFLGLTLHGNKNPFSQDIEKGLLSTE